MLWNNMLLLVVLFNEISTLILFLSYLSSCYVLLLECHYHLLFLRFRYGSWGVCFTYGLWFGVKGLVAAERTYGTCSSIRKACDFILSKQLSSGGWGESYLSCQNKVICSLIVSYFPSQYCMPEDRREIYSTVWNICSCLYEFNVYIYLFLTKNKSLHVLKHILSLQNSLLKPKLIENVVAALAEKDHITINEV